MNTTPVTIAIARTGAFTDSRGAVHTFTTGDLDALAENYTRQTEAAPLVFGHPQDNHPAYGWVKRLYRSGSKLFAQLAQVPCAVRDAVRKGHYKYVSMSLHPGGRGLRHVGLLGAVPPAIPGLGPVEMSSGEAASLNFAASDLADEQGEQEMDAEMQRRLGTLEEQVKNLTAERDKAQTALEAAQAELKQAQEGLSKAEEGKNAAEKEAEDVKAEFSAYRGRQAIAARQARLERLVSAGKVTPGESKDVLAQAEALAKIAQPMEFSDGSKETPEERFWRGLDAREPSALFSRAAPPADFSAMPDKSAASVDLSKKI